MVRAAPAVAVSSSKAYDGPAMPGPNGPPPSMSRHILIPISLVGCFALVYWCRLELYWAFGLGAVSMTLYALAPALGRWGLARFDRAAPGLLAAGRAEALRGRYGRALAMRLFAPPALVAERRGLVAAENGHPGRARTAYRQALSGYAEGAAPLGVVLGMAHASYAMGDDLEAIRLYREVLGRFDSFPRVRRNLAHSLARRGKRLREAHDLLEGFADDSARLIRALILARRSKRATARKILESVDLDDPNLSDQIDEVDEALSSRDSRSAKRARAH